MPDGRPPYTVEELRAMASRYVDFEGISSERTKNKYYDRWARTVGAMPSEFQAFVIGNGQSPPVKTVINNNTTFFILGTGSNNTITINTGGWNPLTKLMTASEADFRGTFRHELGHIIGDLNKDFTHARTAFGIQMLNGRPTNRSVNPAYPEDVKWNAALDDELRSRGMEPHPKQNPQFKPTVRSEVVDLLKGIFSIGQYRYASTAYQDNHPIQSHLVTYAPNQYSSEALAEMARHYLLLHAEHKGNEGRINALMTEAYKHLWPAYRDMVVHGLVKHVAGSAPELFPQAEAEARLKALSEGAKVTQLTPDEIKMFEQQKQLAEKTKLASGGVGLFLGAKSFLENIFKPESHFNTAQGGYASTVESLNLLTQGTIAAQGALQLANRSFLVLVKFGKSIPGIGSALGFTDAIAGVFRGDPQRIASGVGSGAMALWGGGVGFALGGPPGAVVGTILGGIVGSDVGKTTWDGVKRVSEKVAGAGSNFFQAGVNLYQGNVDAAYAHFKDGVGDTIGAVSEALIKSPIRIGASAVGSVVSGTTDIIGAVPKAAGYVVEGAGYVVQGAGWLAKQISPSIGEPIENFGKSVVNAGEAVVEFGKKIERAGAAVHTAINNTVNNVLESAHNAVSTFFGFKKASPDTQTKVVTTDVVQAVPPASVITKEVIKAPETKQAEPKTEVKAANADSPDDALGKMAGRGRPSGHQLNLLTEDTKVPTTKDYAMLLANKGAVGTTDVAAIAQPVIEPDGGKVEPEAKKVAEVPPKTTRQAAPSATV